MTTIQIIMLIITVVNLSLLALFIFLAFHFKNDRDAWRRTAWRASQINRNQTVDVGKAQQVARDLANRGFK